MKRSIKSFAKKASNLYASIHQQLIMYAITAVVVIILLAVTTLFAQPPQTTVSTEAARPSSITPSSGQGDYIAAVEPLFPNQPVVGHCNLGLGNVMDGYCDGPPSSRMACQSVYLPSSCPPGRRVKYVVASRCGNSANVAIPRYWPTCTFD